MIFWKPRCTVPSLPLLLLLLCSLTLDVIPSTEAAALLVQQSSGVDLMGGMSQVTLVKAGTGAPYVHKKTRNVDDMDAMLQEFLVQQTLATACPQHILAPFDWEHQPDSHAAFKMPYAVGGGMMKWIQQWKAQQLNHPLRVKPVLQRVAEAFKCIHDAGYAHLDIKPDNIVFHWQPDTFAEEPSAAQLLDGILDDTVQVVILDFGLTTPHQSPGHIGMCGTSDYMAKEMLTEPGVTDARLAPSADVYSIGMVLKSFFYPVIPVEVPDEEVIAERLQHGDLPPVHTPIQGLDEPLPPMVYDLLSRMLDWNVQRRFNIDRVLSHAFFSSDLL